MQACAQDWPKGGGESQACQPAEAGDERHKWTGDPGQYPGIFLLFLLPFLKMKINVFYWHLVHFKDVTFEIEKEEFYQNIPLQFRGGGRNP